MIAFPKFFDGGPQPGVSVEVINSQRDTVPAFQPSAFCQKAGMHIGEDLGGFDRNQVLEALNHHLEFFANNFRQALSQQQTEVCTILIEVTGKIPQPTERQKLAIEIHALVKEYDIGAKVALRVRFDESPQVVVLKF
jgi:hypothetical protein